MCCAQLEQTRQKHYTVPPSSSAHSTPTFFPCGPAQGDRVILQMPPSILGASSNCEHEFFFFLPCSRSGLRCRRDLTERQSQAVGGRHKGVSSLSAVIDLKHKKLIHFHPFLKTENQLSSAIFSTPLLLN